jgi:hypothetical protein
MEKILKITIDLARKCDRCGGDLTSSIVINCTTNEQICYNCNYLEVTKKLLDLQIDELDNDD